MKRIWNISVFDGIVIAAVFVFVAYFSLLSINRLDTFRSNYFDLGIMDQVVYNTSKGRFLEVTNPHSESNTSRLAIHFDPILALIAPFYFLFPSPIVLLVFQVLAVGLGGWFVYKIAGHITGVHWMSALIAISYLLYFPNQRAVIFDFHAVVLSTCFLLGAVYAELHKKYRLMGVFLVLALLCKEHVGLVVFMYGVYLLLRRTDKRLGGITALVGVGAFLLSYRVIMPFFREGEHFALSYLSEYGTSMPQIVRTLFIRPDIVFGKLFSPDGVSYLVRTVGPVAPFAIFSPLTLLPTVPELMLNTISGSNNMRAVYFHYNALVTPFLFLSAAHGASWAAKKHKYLGYVAAVAFILTTLYAAYWYAPLPESLSADPYIFQPINTEKMRALQAWQQVLADDQIVVSATPRVAPFFTRRREFYNFLYDTGFVGAGISEGAIMEEIGRYQMAEYVFLEKEEAVTEDPIPKAFYTHLRENSDYQKVYDDRYFEVFRYLPAN